MGLRRGLIAFALAACVARAAAEAPADAIQDRIKAAYLSKFPAYVEWPAATLAGPQAPLVIGVTGNERVARELDQALAGRKVAGHPMRVHRIADEEDMDDCCQVLFVGADTASDRAAALLAHSRGRHVLTVTDRRQQPPGSVINFLVVDDHVRFDISRPAAESNGLQLRSQLLAVARQAIDR